MGRGAPESERKPQRVVAYIASVWVSAVAVTGVAWWWYGWPSDPVALTILALMGIASNAVGVPDVGSRVSLSFLSIIVLASIVIVGPVGTPLVAGLAMALHRVEVPLRARVFNTGMATLVAVVGAVVYDVVGGYRQIEDVSTGPLLLHVGVPLMIADVVQCVANAALLAGIMRVASGVSFRRFAWQMLTTSGIAYIGYGFIGFLFVVLWGPAGVGPISALLIVAPLYVARWAFVQYGDEQAAHERTLSALVASVEARDPSAIGHSERIASLAEWMADPLSLSPEQIKDLRYAALLHDIGRVGVPPQTEPPQAASSIDVVAIRGHPDHGVDLVSGIEFLAGAVEGIRHHHERFDGRGYPAGLAGTRIPLYARIIAVADAFDSVTTPRAHRPALAVADALDVVRGRAGTHLDPDVVTALERALERHTWAPTELPEDAVAAAATTFDHDDPQTCDRMADERYPVRPRARST